MKNTLKIVNKNEDITKEFQDLIDKLNVNETLKVVKGKYLIKNLYLHSNMNIMFEDGVELISNYKSSFDYIYTRVAGINMNWYAGLINIIDSKNVSIKGHAVINGMGEYFYNLYWGPDQLGGIRKEYDAKGIRFLADYDLPRPRNILVQNSSNIIIEDIESLDSAFWNIHILYSHDVLLNNIYINSRNLNAPSTDGIDIDSSYNVKVINATTYTNDDSICIKSGRDSDGLKTNIPTHDVEIRDCHILKGFGLTIGSEVSGGIYNINVNNITFDNTDCGFRIKSSFNRKGYIKDINLTNLKLNNVRYPILIQLDWNKSYSNTTIPSGLDIEYKDYYYKLIENVSDDIPNTIIDNINIDNMCAQGSSNSRAFDIIGFKDMHIQNFNIKNSKFDCVEFGRIENANINFLDTSVSTCGKNSKVNDEYDNR